MKNRTIKCKVKLNTENLYELLKNYYELKCPATYTEKGSYQCKAKAARGFTDLLRLSKHYFPKTTQKQLAQTLEKLSKIKLVGMIYCGEVKRITFFAKKEHMRWADFFINDYDNYISFKTKGIQRYKTEIVSINQFTKLLNK